MSCLVFLWHLWSTGTQYMCSVKNVFLYVIDLQIKCILCTHVWYLQNKAVPWTSGFPGGLFWWGICIAQFSYFTYSVPPTSMSSTIFYRITPPQVQTVPRGDRATKCKTSETIWLEVLKVVQMFECCEMQWFVALATYTGQHAVKFIAILNFTVYADYALIT